MRRRRRALLCALSLLLGGAAASRPTPTSIAQAHPPPPLPIDPPRPAPPVTGPASFADDGLGSGGPRRRRLSGSWPQQQRRPVHTAPRSVATGPWLAGSLAALVLLGAAVAVACVGKRKPRTQEQRGAEGNHGARAPSPPPRHIYVCPAAPAVMQLGGRAPCVLAPACKDREAPGDASGGPPSYASGHQSFHSSHSPGTHHHSSLYLSPAAPRPPGQCALTEEGFGKHTQSTSLGSWGDTEEDAASDAIAPVATAAAAAAAAAPRPGGERPRGLHTQSASLSSWSDEDGCERGVHTQSASIESGTDDGYSPSGLPGAARHTHKAASAAGSGCGGAAEGLLATQRAGSAHSDADGVRNRHEQLKRHLHAMSAARAPELFLGRYRLLRERRVGGQALVQFARGGDGGYFQYAIKFFNRVKNYCVEERMYRNPALRYCLPDLYAASPNEDGAARTAGGYVFPPFLVMERGMTLAEWLQAPRDALAVLSMFQGCAALLATMHEAGHAHRDLKPDNILLMAQSQTWRLIDVGIASAIGQETPPQCTLGYAAPELVIAHEERRPVTATAALDVWALGVMVFEAFARRPAVAAGARVEGCRRLARGAERYPWEEPEQARAFGGSRARELVELCLARDAAKRPSAALLVERIRAISHRTGSSDDNLREA